MRLAVVKAAASLLLLLCPMLWSPPTLAFRPFDGTDAAVADPGQVEIELQPAGYRREGSEHSLTGPGARFNYGFAEGWEAVLEGVAVHELSAGDRRSSLVDNALSLKHVLRDGSLQEKTGPSVATEWGLLLPGLNDDSGVGGSVALIASQQWPWATVHLNLAVAVTRQQHGDVFVGAIVEGPRDWPVRPVAEVFHERDFGGQTTESGLIGAIWQVRETLSFDAGLRRARVNDHSLDEIRAGLTFAFGVKR
jgi:hypothetical protein